MMGMGMMGHENMRNKDIIGFEVEVLELKIYKFYICTYTQIHHTGQSYMYVCTSKYVE